MKTRAGFTLLELAAVILLIGVAAAVAAPAMLREHRPPAAERAATDLVNFFVKARRHALANAVRVRVIVSGINAVVRADALTPNGATRIFEQELDLPAEVKIDPAGRTEWMFDPAGAAMGDSIAIESETSRVSILLDPLTGRAITR